MNQRKIVVIAFFVVVFGLPVGWYLFLQAFGENQFALPVLEAAEFACEEESKTYAIVRLDSVIGRIKPNERQRVIKKLMDIGEVKLVEGNKDSCKWKYEMTLIDHEGMIRGIYDLKREEVDRFMAEVDIYVLNYRNGTSTGK